MELLALAPVEKANEVMKILEDCMVQGSEFYMKRVPMKAEGAMGYSWRKEAGYCYVCKTEVEDDKTRKPFFTEVQVQEIYGRFVPCCTRCYISYLASKSN